MSTSDDEFLENQTTSIRIHRCLFTRFNSSHQTLEFSGGEDSLFSEDLVDSTSPATADEQKACVERVKAKCLIQRSDPNRYSELVTELKNASYVGNDECPSTSADAHDLLLRRCNIVPTASNNRRRGNGLMFTQTEDGGNDQPVPGRDGTILLDKRCFRCQKRGHIRPNCPEVT